MSEKTEPLAEAVIDKALQKPSMMFGVPLVTVFLPEIFIFMILFVILGFWAVVLLPLHVVLMTKSNANVFWVEDLITDFFEIKLSPEVGVRGKNVVTHHPNYTLVKRKDSLL